jgi:urease accessory protein
MSGIPEIQSEGWRAGIRLEFDLLDHRTRMTRSLHEGPLGVQRPFYPGKKAADECQVYLLHPPGGFVGNDLIDIEGKLAERTHVLVTTPSAGKFYRVLPGCWQRQEVRWSIKSGAALAWVPQENIFFRGCLGNVSTLFRLEQDSHLFTWDMSVLGRGASGERFDSGSVRQELTLVLENRLLLKERFVLDAGELIQRAPWGLGASQVFATALLYGPKFVRQFDTIQSMVSDWSRHEQVRAGVTLKKGVMVIRYLGPKISQCRSGFEQLMSSLGKPEDGHEMPGWTRPRIWST